MERKKHNILSFITPLIILITCFWVYTAKGDFREKKIITNDVSSYYAYLPAVFYHDDITLKFYHKDYWEFCWSAPVTDSTRVIKMSMGMAYFYFPFYQVARICNDVFNGGGSPFGMPYQFAIGLSGLIYFVIGLYFLRRVMLRYFSDGIVALTFFIIAFGTNMYYYLTVQAAMSHAVNFMLFCAFLYFTVKWYEKPAFRTTILLGLTAGLITIIRPTNVIVCIVFLLYGITNRSDIKPRLSFLIANYKWLLLAALVFLVPVFPQLAYWKYLTGHWYFYSYGDEGFFFSNPHLIEGLFGYRKGWLLYTPLMIFALCGLFLIRKYFKNISLGIIVFTIVNMYVILSWWCWWYEGCGMRPMTDSYAFLAIPLASFLTFMMEKFSRGVVMLVMVFVLIKINLFQVFQFEKTIIHWNSMTKESYWHVFLNLHYAPQSMLKAPDVEKAMRGENEE